jgi:hypothetical protein
MEDLNWLAVIVGTGAALGLGMVWFGPLFGRTWATGNHSIQPPARPQMLAMAAQLLGTFALALVIGLTATLNALGTALLAVTALALLLFAGGLFSQKSLGAAAAEGGFALAMGAVMILTQGLF